MTALYTTLYPSPVGLLRLVADDTHLRILCWADEERIPIPDAIPTMTPLLETIKHQLNQYFFKQRTEFDVPLRPHGTPFQQQVWNALCTIPYGQTRSYSQQAILIQKPKAVRATGVAHGRNPIAIVIPCHRVVGKNGSLIGYAGNKEKGLCVKKWLLDWEGQ
jgi:methylated-DNA-[protein]-cysteine S-methyltransferase